MPDDKQLAGRRATTKWLLRLVPPKEWVPTGLALLALIVSVWSLAADRLQDVRSNRPHLRVDELFATSSPRIGLEITNIGAGIAIPDSFALTYKGESLQHSPDDSYEVQWNRFRDRTGTRGWTNIGAFEPMVAQGPNHKDILIIVDESDERRKKDPETWAKNRRDLLQAVRGDLTIAVGYHSVYGERFLMRKTVFGAYRFYRPGWLMRLGLSSDSWREWKP